MLFWFILYICTPDNEEWVRLINCNRRVYNNIHRSLEGFKCLRVTRERKLGDMKAVMQEKQGRLQRTDIDMD